MKKLLIFAALVVAIGSYGGHIGTAHADTLTPSQTAALQQQLQVAKATLVNLEMEAGMVPAGDNGTSTVTAPVMAVPVAAPTPTVMAPSATTGLSASQVSAFEGTLSTLAATLMQLNTSIAATSATLSATQQQAVQTTLNGMQGTLVAMANTIKTDESANNSAVNTAPVAMANPSSGSTANGSGLAQNTPSAPTAVTAPSTVMPTTPTPTQTQTPTVTAQVTPTTNNTAPQQTAQASSLWSFTKSHWPAIVIIILVIGILAILFWPEKETVRTVPSNNLGPNRPKSPSQPNVTISQSTTSSTTTTTGPARPISSNNPSGTSTPISTVVGGTHSQKA
jgi:hypothetical protein